MFANLSFIPTKRLKEDCYWNLSFAIDANTDHIFLINLEFQPCASAWDDLAYKRVFVCALIWISFLEVDAR